MQGTFCGLTNRSTSLTYLPCPQNRCIGREIVHKLQCTSTNDVATQLLRQQRISAGAVVVADHQTQGRGQRGATWHSAPSENLLCSIALTPTFLPTSHSFALSAMTALAVRDTLLAYLPGALLTVKWPNDIYYHNQKLGGILIENTITQRSLQTSIVGIGLNVNQIHFSTHSTTSLALASGRSFDLPTLFTALLEALDQHYQRLHDHGSALLYTAYQEHLYWRHEEHTFQDQDRVFQGTIRGVDYAGRLMIVERGGEAQWYSAKEVAFLC